jgi:hypothetical protein
MSLASETAQAPALYRLHVRPAGDPAAAFQYCLDESVLGTGWGPTRWGDPSNCPTTWGEYLVLARELWSEREFGPVRWLRDAPEGTLVWTRDTHGIYYLACLNGPWEYRDATVNRDLDLSNVRPAEIVRVPGAEARVPGAVVKGFSGRGQAFRQVVSVPAALYSQHLFARSTGRATVPWHPSTFEVLDVFLDPFDAEDLVAAYLQATRGWIALPTRSDKSKLAYEYMLRDPGDGQIYAVQVKTGDAQVPVQQLSNADGLRWIVFSARKRWIDPLPGHVHAIEPTDIVAFMQSQPHALPPVVSGWMTFVNDASKPQ